MAEDEYLKNFLSQPMKQRVVDCVEIRRKYPGRFPIIVSKLKKTGPDKDKHKFLCPGDLTFGQFVYVIKKRIKMRFDEALFVFVNKSVLIPSHATLEQVYFEHRDKDGFLYAFYDLESTFG